MNQQRSVELIIILVYNELMNAITGAVSYNTKKVDKPYRKKSLVYKKKAKNETKKGQYWFEYLKYIRQIEDLTKQLLTAHC